MARQITVVSVEEALTHPALAVIDCPVDYGENDRLLTM